MATRWTRADGDLFLCSALDETGLLPDPFVHLLHSPRHHSRHRHGLSGGQVSPLLRRGTSSVNATIEAYWRCYPLGTFIRTKAIDGAIRKIVQQSEDKVQVVVLGAGYDTRWLRQLYKDPQIELFIEIDLAEVIDRKRRALGRFLDEDPRHVLLEHDLLEDPAKLLFKLRDCTGIRLQQPIIFVSECCFMYIQATQVSRLLGYLAKAIPRGHLILYDPLLLLGDPFSEQMIRNFHQRGISLESHAVKSEEQLKDRWQSSGWQVECFAHMSQIEGLDGLLDGTDRQQLSRMAMLDEYEEWNLISDHYYLAILQSSN